MSRSPPHTHTHTAGLESGKTTLIDGWVFECVRRNTPKDLFSPIPETIPQASGIMWQPWQTVLAVARQPVSVLFPSWNLKSPEQASV